MSRKAVGLAAFDRSRLTSAQFASHGSNLRTSHASSLSTQLSVFRSLLQQFAQTHAKDIRSNPTFRAEFGRMCAAIGVDPRGGGVCGGGGGLWADEGGEWGVDAGEGVSAEDYEGEDGGGAGNHRSEVLKTAQIVGYVTLSTLVLNLKWSKARAKTAVDDLVAESMLWVDSQCQEWEYWSPGFVLEVVD
ncbi:hypothetical protein V502_09658 [Pseudogymnoascus sp. VKM F-4520 (FW-2644)]|nr:hypothetical protein V502_09658 [Pseudogymnoascus sp. VKM F-4520 (FW-2644)]